jgi:hypothetical protein
MEIDKLLDKYQSELESLAFDGRDRVEDFHEQLSI